MIAKQLLIPGIVRDPDFHPCLPNKLTQHVLRGINPLSLFNVLTTFEKLDLDFFLLLYFSKLIALFSGIQNIREQDFSYKVFLTWNVVISNVQK